MNLKINPSLNLSKNQKINFASCADIKPDYEIASSGKKLYLFELQKDTFEKSTDEENEASGLSYDVFEDDDDIIIAAGPLGHPYTGRPAPNSQKATASLMDWLLSSASEREGYEPPALIKLLSLGDNNFNDDVSKFHAQIAQNAKETAINLFNTKGEINIPIGDINKDGMIDKIISGVNRAIDINGDNKADVIGTLIDIDGDNKADYILTQMGKLIKLNGQTATVLDSKNITVDDIELIPKIVRTLLGKGK